MSQEKKTRPEGRAVISLRSGSVNESTELILTSARASKLMRNRLPLHAGLRSIAFDKQEE